MYSTKIVKKKKINAVCGIALLLSVIFLMTSCPNGINVDNANGNNPGGNHHEGGNDPVTPPAPLTDEQKIEAVLKKVKITNDSFNAFQLGSNPSEEELNAIEGKIETIFEKGDTPSAWLGLARKEGDNKLYLITMDDYITKASCFITQVSTIQENGRKISKEVSNDPIADHPVLTGVDDSQICFDSVKDALEWRWKNMIVDFPDPDSPNPDQNSTSNPFLFCTGSYPWLTFWPSDMFGPDYVGLLFAVKTEENEPKVYFRNDGHSKLIADWTITFVKADKVYAFRVGGSNYKILHDANNHLMNNSEKISGENIKFKIGLSSLVEISLMEQFVKAGISEKDAGDKANNFVKNFAPLKDGCKDLKDWDVYLTLGDMIDDTHNVDDGRNPLFAWRNTFKLVEANPNITNNEVKRFWSRCWK